MAPLSFWLACLCKISLADCLVCGKRSSPQVDRTHPSGCLALGLLLPIQVKSMDLPALSPKKRSVELNSCKVTTCRACLEGQLCHSLYCHSTTVRVSVCPEIFRVWCGVTVPELILVTLPDGVDCSLFPQHFPTHSSFKVVPSLTACASLTPDLQRRVALQLRLPTGLEHPGQRPQVKSTATPVVSQQASS